jgi:hypothetical protein
MSKPIGMATIPSEAATLSQLAAPVMEAKFLPPKIAKNTKTATSPRKEPVSGRRRRLPREKPRPDEETWLAKEAWPSEEPWVLLFIG